MKGAVQTNTLVQQTKQGSLCGISYNLPGNSVNSPVSKQ